MCDIAVADGISSNENSTQTCCKQRFGTAGSTFDSDVETNVVNANHSTNCVTSSSDTDSVNSSELLGESRFHAHVQSSSVDKDHSSDADVKSQECSDQMTMSWQRIRSLIMAVLGFVVRMCLSSVILSQFVQVTYLPYFTYYCSQC